MNKKNSLKINKKSGFALIELLIGMSIMVISIISIISAYGALSNIAYRNTDKLQATFLTQEGMEAIRTMRDSSWAAQINTLSTTTTYRLYWNSAAWLATTSQIRIDSFFDRTFTISNVSRDASFNIVASGGTVDSGTRKVTVKTAWLNSGATTTKASDFYLFNTYNN